MNQQASPDFTALPDLASRALGASVVYANDELFGAREHLIRPEPPTYAPVAFGPKGKVYDGWETRRRREPGHDHAIVRLGAPGVVHGVVVDTSHFRGNYPPYVAIEAAAIDGYPSPTELPFADWVTLVERSPVTGDTANAFSVADERRFTHVRLSIYPDGGVARLRVHGRVVPDPAWLTGTVDLAALENGARVLDCSDRFYSSPVNLILPGRARHMGEGWETARRRDAGNDFVVLALAASGRVRRVEVDTSWFVGNAPDSIALTGAASLDALASAPVELLGRTRVQPDTRHRFVIASAEEVAVVRLDVYPDGGLARLRLWGEVVGHEHDLGH